MPKASLRGRLSMASTANLQLCPPESMTPASALVLGRAGVKRAKYVCMANSKGDLKRARERRRNSRLRPPLKTKASIADRAGRGRKKFLRFFPGGFKDETYVEWERKYRWQPK